MNACNDSAYLRDFKGYVRPKVRFSAFILYFCTRRVYHIYMRKTQKAFTLIEVVMSLGLIGIFFALTAVVVVGAANVQDFQARELAVDTELTKAQDFLDDVVSYVSVNTTSRKFVVSFSSESEISFECNSDTTYTLRKSVNSIIFTNNYEGDDSYNNHSGSISFEELNVKNFAFDNTTYLFKVNFDVPDYGVISFAYSLEVLK